MTYIVSSGTLNPTIPYHDTFRICGQWLWSHSIKGCQIITLNLSRGRTLQWGEG